ncbi:MAG: GGDEF domain-containing protein [Gammaproteobacteria bacterium]|nr:MAG: GGDEF domain-containing protein [Gammaproteobacteria bacterium]
MNILKRFIPILLLLLLALFAYTQYNQLPRAVINAVIFLPVVLFVAVLILSLHFNRSPVFFYSLLIMLTNLVLGMEWAVSSLSYGLLSCFVPLLLLTFTLLPERGIFSIRALPAHSILLFTVIVCIWLALSQPAWASYMLLHDWLPARYFDWTPIPQSVLASSVLVFLAMLVLIFLRPSTHMFAGFGVLLMLFAQLHVADISRGLNVFSSIALLMCLYAVLQESWRMAYLDELTEIPGRRALREKFQKISGVYSVAMVDVDHFKKFNDTYGHETGDAVLRMIAAKLMKVSGGGTAYRYGGEEFTLVFNGKSSQQALEHLEALREKIASTPFVVNREGRRRSDRGHVPHQSKSVQVTASIGVADSESNVASPWDVMKLADKALYRAKKKGRNRVEIH